MSEETKEYKVVKAFSLEGAEHAEGETLELTEAQVSSLPEGSVEAVEPAAENGAGDEAKE